MTEERKPYQTRARAPASYSYQPWGVVYLGPEERDGDYSLDTYRDTATGRTFTRQPFESLEEAIARIRSGGIRDGGN